MYLLVMDLGFLLKFSIVTNLCLLQHFRSALEISMSENLQGKSSQLVLTDGPQSQTDQVATLYFNVAIPNGVDLKCI